MIATAPPLYGERDGDRELDREEIGERADA